MDRHNGSLKVKSLPTCEYCLEGKMTKRPFLLEKEKEVVISYN